jgi:uncharacterized protein YraI
MKKTLLPILFLAALAWAGGTNTAVADIVQCTDEGTPKPCSLIVDTIDGQAVDLPTGTLSSYTGQFDTGSKVSVSVLRRQGASFVVEAESDLVTADGGTQTIETSLPVAGGGRTIALNLWTGSVGALENPESRILATDSPLSVGDTATGDAAAYDLSLSVEVSGGAEPEPTATPDQAPAKGFSIDRRAVLSADGRHLNVYTLNETEQELDGSIAVKGQKGSANVWHYDYHSSSDFSLPVGRKLRKKLLRGKPASLTVVARTGGGTFTQTVRAIRGGAKGYDGTYRGSNGLTFVVKRGVITAISQSLNTYCSANGRFVTRTMQVGLGFPALIGKDGSFDHKASYSADSFTYRGKLERNGSAKGYNSLWYTTFDNDPSSGNIRAVSCVQASNWTASRK